MYIIYTGQAVEMVDGAAAAFDVYMRGLRVSPGNPKLEGKLADGIVHRSSDCFYVDVFFWMCFCGCVCMYVVCVCVCVHVCTHTHTHSLTHTYSVS